MDRFVLFKNLMIMAMADGRIADEEASLLSLRAKKWGLSPEQVQEAIDNAAAKEAALFLPKSKEDRLILLRELVHMMSIDGDLAEIEKRLCAWASAAMKITSEEFDRILDEVL
jgi:uncharacterized tellurite resistance protein B-like protein